MRREIDRRKFLKTGAAAAAGVALGAARGGRSSAAAAAPTLRVGVIGTGNRGKSLLEILLSMKDVMVPALCDIDKDNLAEATGMVEKAGQKKPEDYSRGQEDFQRLLYREDLDAVLIAAPWEWHTPMACLAMRTGKYAGVEVPAAITFDQCWDLVNAHEETGVPCMMLENWSFRDDNLAVLKMIRAGLLGEMVHCHCAHSHDCIDHWFFDPEGNMRWGGRYLIERNADQYPTHSLGPVISWMDIGCGDYFATIASNATRSAGINAYFTRKFGPDHPNARREYKQGDIVTSVVKTHKGNTIVINYDMQLPRPYDNRWMVQGTLGIYNEQRNSVYLTGRSPQYHEWEPFEPYHTKHRHSWWKALDSQAGELNHGGTDYLELQQFLKAVRNKTQTPVDVYDSVAMSSIVALSEKSIAEGGRPVECPDFTRGKWKTKKPAFALES